MPDVLSTWFRLRNEAEAADADALERLARVYAAGYRDIDPLVKSLIEKLETLQKSGKLTRAQVEKLAAFKALINSASGELSDFTSYLRSEVKAEAPEAARRGLTSEAVLLAASLGTVIGAKIPFSAVSNAPPDALDFLARYLDQQGPLYKRINFLAPFHADAISGGILEMVGKGQNPRVIGKWITDAYGMGLTDSIRVTRTVQLYSYRGAARAVQVANADVLQGLVWVADIDDPRTCMSCIAQHGQVYPVGSICDDHHNGRCALIPWVKGMDNPIDKTGENWFSGLSDANQKARMGETKWQAWQDGKFEFSQLTTSHQDEVFGAMKTEASLKSLLG